MKLTDLIEELSKIHPGTSKEYIAEMVPPIIGYQSSIPPSEVENVVPFGSVARQELELTIEELEKDLPDV